MKLNDILRRFGKISRKQAMAAIIKFGDNSDFEERAFESDFYGLRYRGHTENLIDKHIYFLGTYEGAILQFIAEILGDGRDRVFVDIGANTGVHSLFASRYAKKVFAFEPYLPASQMLMERLALNSLENVIVINNALGDKTEEMVFYEPGPRNLGTGSFIKNFNPNNASEGATLQILNATEAFEANQINAAELIKIDTEGFEFSILAGLLPFLKNHRPHIIFEYSVSSFSDFNSNNPVSEFLRANYMLEALEDQNNVTLTRSPWKLDRYCNVLCTPK